MTYAENREVLKGNVFFFSLSLYAISSKVKELNLHLSVHFWYSLTLGLRRTIEKNINMAILFDSNIWIR